MEKYKASTQQAEVLGAGLLAYENAIERDEFMDILSQYGLTAVDPEAWYPQQLTLDVQNAIKATNGGSQSLVSIGMAIIEGAKFPPIASLAEAVDSLAVAYQMNHRNLAETDRVIVNHVSDEHIEVINATPNSDDVLYGYIYAIIRRFKPEGKRLIVEYADIDRRDSDDDTLFVIELAD
ncbi:MAG: hypothetical protein AAF787_03060 [Chloroflexota bacterium]